MKKVLLLITICICFFFSSSSKANVNQVNGFYPIWENTGYTLRSSSLLLGYSNLQYGFADSHIGLHPNYYFYRAPNLHYKQVIFTNKSMSIALQGEVLVFMKNSGESLSEFYSSRIDNPDYTLWLFPFSTAQSWNIFERVTLHQTLTLLPLFATGALKNNISVGYSAVAEFLAGRKHALFLHSGEVGFWSHDFWYSGFSYRYARSSFWIQVGYFYRFRTDGTQQSPLIELGLSI